MSACATPILTARGGFENELPFLMSGLPLFVVYVLDETPKYYNPCYRDSPKSIHNLGRPPC